MRDPVSIEPRRPSSIAATREGIARAPTARISQRLSTAYTPMLVSTADKKCVMLLAWRCTAGNGRVAAGTPRSIAPIATTRVAATR